MKIEILLTSILVITTIPAFYWYQIRPSRIRHDCSWSKVVDSAIPAYPTLTEKELIEKNMLQSCEPKLAEVLQGQENPIIKDFNTHRKSVCEATNRKTVEEYSKPREAVSEKISWRKATNTEYLFCLHDKGL